MTFHLIGNTIYFAGNYVGTLDPAADYGPREDAKAAMEDYHPELPSLEVWEKTNKDYAKLEENSVDAAEYAKLEDRINDLEGEVSSLEDEVTTHLARIEELEAELYERTKHLDD